MAQFFSIDEIVAQAVVYADDDYSFWVAGNHRGQFYIVWDDREIHELMDSQWDWVFILPNDDVEFELREYFS